MLLFDFAVLGDAQPEGLLVAAGLVRKGFSVVVVPSTALGELPSDESWPLILPAQLGQRKLNDLLFRAGFFRLEESGLVATQFGAQVLLPKNRLFFQGTYAQYLLEIEREFPHALKTFETLFQSRKNPSLAISKAAEELFEIQKRDGHFRNWLLSEIRMTLRPSIDDELMEHLVLWLNYLLKQESKAYRVDLKVKTPYHQFLLEHARKWGASVCSEPCDLKSSWTFFQVSKTTRASHIILNGVGAGRALAKSILPKLAERMKYWMYLDVIHCPLSVIPEPLHEFAQISLGDSVEGVPGERVLHLSVDRLRGEAKLSLGSWLLFDDSKTWITQIEKGREALKKIVPFLLESSLKPLPSSLELHELRGECIRRGQLDRLIPEVGRESRLERFKSRLLNRLPLRRKPRTLGRRIYALNPHFLRYRNRMASFDESLTFLDHFEKKKKKQLSQS